MFSVIDDKTRVSANNVGHKLAREKLFGRKVDKFCEDTKTVYIFHGCFWHGCRKCFGNIENKNKRKNFDAKYLSTIKWE